jgi:glycosyltransferase involved in cell wall biosynthesis
VFFSLEVCGAHCVHRQEPVRIAVVSTPFVPVPPPRYGGTELVVWALIEELARRGHEVTLYATGDSRANVSSIRAHYSTAIWPPNAYQELTHASFAICDLLQRDDVDVIHLHVPTALPFARLLDVPVVYTMHADRDEALNDLLQASQTSNLTMIAISERQRERMDDVCAAEVVHHGLPPERYPLGDGKGDYAAFLGRFARDKGPHAAIDASLRAGVPIRLAGQPHWKDEAYYRAEVETRLRKKGVTWMGEASHEPKVSMLGGAIATLFPIAWEEPFGLVRLESMLCGTPVIAFGRGAAGELVDQEITGWIVRDVDEMADRLGRVARARVRFDRARCRAHAIKRFSAERMTDDYLAVYTMAVNGIPAGTRAASPHLR